VLQYQAQSDLGRSAVERAGLSTLNENQVVEYDLVENRGKSSAENLKIS
jgi:CspA family cold shock protein